MSKTKATATVSQRGSAETRTIIVGGDDAVRLPGHLIVASWMRPPGVAEWKVLVALFRLADPTGWWSTVAAQLARGEEPEPMRLEAAAVRDDAGYAADADLDTVYAALDGLKANAMSCVEDGPLAPILDYRTLHGRRWVEVMFSGDLILAHQEIRSYGLVNLGHIRRLRTRLDCLLYALACLHAKRAHPVFTLPVAGAAAHCGIGQNRDWSAFGRPLRLALQRVADVTGARFSVHAYSVGDLPGIDSVDIHVGHAATPRRERFQAARRQSRKFVVKAARAAPAPSPNPTPALDASPSSTAIAPASDQAPPAAGPAPTPPPDDGTWSLDDLPF
jgi:hypothetical protein